MKDYSAMSDFDINLLVNRSLRLKHYPNEEKKVIEVFGDIVIFDPCNNPADAWPIITENSIVIMPYMMGEKPALWLCFDVNNSDLDCQDGNPLRAAMIVFLMMKDAEKCDG